MSIVPRIVSLALCCSLGLIGCGIKGPLQPAPKSPSPAAASPAAPGDDAPARERKQ